MDETASVHDNEEAEQEIEEEDGLAEIEEEDDSAIEDDASRPDSACGGKPSIGSVETVDDANEEQNVIVDDPPRQPAEQHPNRQADNPVPAAVRGLDCKLNGPHWVGGVIGAVTHKHYIGSVMREYNNLESVLVSSTPQYGFQKGMKVFREEGHTATVKELSKNLIGKNVIDMLPAKSVTHDMMKMSLSYLMFLKRKRNLEVKARGCADGTLPRSNLVHHV